MDEKQIENLADHHELIHWIHYMSYSAATVDKMTVNIEDRDFLKLPSGKKVRITIKVEEVK